MLKQIDSAIAIRIYQKLLNKGFQRVIYQTQEKPNIWYRIEFTDEQLMEKFIEVLNEDKGYWECSFDNMIISFEIREDLSYVQYLIIEQETKFDGNAFDELTIDEFEEILNMINDKVMFLL